MQLRVLFDQLRRFWLMIVAVPLLTGVLSMALVLAAPPRFQATARLMVSQASYARQEGTSLPDLDRNYSWDSSTFILDDLPQVVSSVAFARDVQSFIQQQGLALEVGSIQQSLQVDVLHRAVYLTAQSNDPVAARAIVNGAVYALQANGLKYWNRAGDDDSGLNVAILDPPGDAVRLGSMGDLVVEVGLRSGLALGAALGLALLLSYLDGRLWSVQQAEEWTGATVIGCIPKERR